MASASMLLIAFCFAGSLLGIVIDDEEQVGHAIFWEARKQPFNQASFDRSLAELGEATVNTTSAADEGNSALHWAFLHGDTSAITVLLNQKDIDIEHRNDQGVTPIFSAVMSETPFQETELLIKAGANLNASRTHINTTPLHEAVAYGKHKITRALLAKHVNINLQDNKGNTALHYSVIFNNVSDCRKLITAEANRHVRNSLQRTPLDMANLTGQTEMAKLLTQTITA